MSKPFAITPVHDLLLRGSQDMPVGLYHLHLATAEQLTRLHYKLGTLKTVKKRLKVLVDNGYVQADCIPTKLFKSPYYYTLAAKGMRYLSDIGMDTDASFRASKEVSESYLHLRHALELNDVFIAALRLKHTHPQYYLSRFIHERTLKRTPYKAGNVTLIPDGFLDIRQRQTERSLPLVLEHDRGTEQQEHFRRRIRAYSAFLSSGAYKQLFGTERVTVAFTTFISSKRVAQMREWTKTELATEPQLAGMFIFAELPKPLEPRNLLFERRWYTLASDQPIALLEG
jgi:Replication-relaxation